MTDDYVQTDISGHVQDKATAYPVCSVPLEPCDCLVLYTDGVTETDNATI